MKVLECQVWLVVTYVIVKTAIHKILVFFTCPKYTNALQMWKSADFWLFLLIFNKVQVAHIITLVVWCIYAMKVIFRQILSFIKKLLDFSNQVPKW